MKTGKRGPAIVLFYAMFLIFVAGCGGQKVRLGDAGLKGNALFSFLKDGRTTKSEITSRLGQRQDGEYEDGRILIYVLDNKYRIVHSGDKSRYHLILVFDVENGMILTRHSLVRIR
jgi:hypothetical protein